MSPNVCEIGKPELSTDLLEISGIAAVKQASDLWCAAADHPALGHIPRRATAILIFNLGCAVPWTGSFWERIASDEKFYAAKAFVIVISVLSSVDDSIRGLKAGGDVLRGPHVGNVR